MISPLRTGLLAVIAEIIPTISYGATPALSFTSGIGILAELFLSL